MLCSKNLGVNNKKKKNPVLKTVPYTRDLVLVGGGHAHALVLKAWGMNPLPGARLTVINPGPTAPYTGMLPGFVAKSGIFQTTYITQLIILVSD